MQRKTMMVLLAMGCLLFAFIFISVAAFGTGWSVFYIGYAASWTNVDRNTAEHNLESDFPLNLLHSAVNDSTCSNCIQHMVDDVVQQQHDFSELKDRPSTFRFTLAMNGECLVRIFSCKCQQKYIGGGFDSARCWDDEGLDRMTAATVVAFIAAGFTYLGFLFAVPYSLMEIFDRRQGCCHVILRCFAFVWTVMAAVFGIAAGSVWMTASHKIDPSSENVSSIKFGGYAVVLSILAGVFNVGCVVAFASIRPSRKDWGGRGLAHVDTPLS